jgi:2OG-Fe(II) oxygenase superfamily
MTARNGAPKTDPVGMKMATTDRTTSVLSFIRTNLSLSRSVSDLFDDYRHAKPYPHLVLDDLFPPEELHALLDELPPDTGGNWVHEKNERYVKSNLRSAVYLQDHGYAFTSVLHSAAFLYFLTEVTGIKALLPDPYLRGAGFHVMGEGGRFEVHADTNTDSYCGLHRRLAMMIYLNKGWTSDLGGQLELWNQDATRCEKVIEPLFNRTVIFEIGETNFHAVRPIVSGLGARRKSFAAYFHTVTQDLEFHNSIYTPSIYRDRPSLLRRFVRATMPPFVWAALKEMKKRHKMRNPDK